MLESQAPAVIILAQSKLTKYVRTLSNSRNAHGSSLYSLGNLARTLSRVERLTLSMSV
jgi:hypothetical protein